MAPPLSRLGDRSVTRIGAYTEKFHESAIFFGVWLLVIFVGVHTLAAMRNILEPLLWAFFLMMGLMPLTDALERCLSCGRRPKDAQGLRKRNSDAEAIREDAEDAEDSEGSASSLSGQGGACGSPKKPWYKVCLRPDCGCARLVAVLVTLTFFVGLVTAFGVMIYRSALHMQNNWHYYQAGFARLSKYIDKLKKHFPDEVLESLAKKALTTLEEVSSALVGSLLDFVSSFAIEAIMCLLYLVFWLCTPIHVGRNVSLVFKHYIMLKTFVSAMYALSVWCLLHYLGVDLSVVFGLITFVLNFIPEVGPFLAMVMPLPVIAFDGRIDAPFFVLCLAFGGQMGLKFIFGNIVEVKLIESRESMRMHPVVILFFVAVFGWIWGATGMLLSVPLMATAKATVHMIPKVYRDVILILLEGDLESPQRWEEYHERTLSEQRAE